MVLLPTLPEIANFCTKYFTPSTKYFTSTLMRVAQKLQKLSTFNKMMDRHGSVPVQVDCNIVSLKRQFSYHIIVVIKRSYSFQNNAKDLDPSYKMDLDVWDCLDKVNSVLLQNFEQLSHSRGENPVL